jgi:predicted nucleic acid-binding protein
MILFDTNIFIEIYRDNSSICDIADNLDRGDIALCDIVRAELFFGARNKHELYAMDKDLSDLKVFSVLPQISTMAVTLVKNYALSHKLSLPDAYIAATALYHDLELWTLNVKDFVFIPNLKLHSESQET